MKGWWWKGGGWRRIGMRREKEGEVLGKGGGLGGKGWMMGGDKRYVGWVRS